jgi:ribonuclease H
MPIIHISPIPPSCTPSTPCVLGIDEAGRGPLLGPMVYGAAFWPEDEADEIAKFGFDDSKALTAVKREALFKRMNICGRIGYVTHSCTAREISAEMLRRSPVSLNVISHDAAASMLELVLARGVRVEKVFVDTVGEPGYYQSKLEKIFNQGNGGGGGASKRGWSISFVVSKKADSLFKSVSAASIAAKVTRDASIRDWVFEEPALAHIHGGNKSEEVTTTTSPSKLLRENDNETVIEQQDDLVKKDFIGINGKKKKIGRQVIDDSDDDNEITSSTIGTSISAIEVFPTSSTTDIQFSETDNEETEKTADSGPLLTVSKRRRLDTDSFSTHAGLHPISAGSGYPGDEKTKAWALKHFDPVFGWPSIVRFSWAPARDALERDGVIIQWEENTQPTVKSFFSSSFSSSSKAASSWLKKRRIENCGNSL